MKGIRKIIVDIQANSELAMEENLQVEFKGNASAIRRERQYLMNIIHLCRQGRFELTRQKNEMPVRKRKKPAVSNDPQPADRVDIKDYLEKPELFEKFKVMYKKAGRTSQNDEPK